MYTVQNMDYCELFYVSNHTLAQTMKINFALTKVINRTEWLDYSGSFNYSGIWIPTSTHGQLNDYLAYLHGGAYLRYLSTQHTLTVTFTETEFYVINQQEPIARTGETIFHSVLFTTTLIGVFALVLLVFKLVLMPVVRGIIKCKKSLSKYHKPSKKELIEENTVF